eukprot:CAMPEP_0194693788 /NCGR_PEP_ID=MMETSP0295-20121207/20790_1 /TAXON_ID=39354 /ORGANISM="Heterosigma akashiwo, Strain CCMP2393" /LENGTH=142 /DNA_ID=CAMNT_0039584837 /DNA_START=86 /DNA_END=510 /DNA_ORIENTATION=-
MFSKLAFNQLKGILGEIFEDVDENTLEISMLGDLFSESHVELSDLYLKQDIINDLLPPFNITRAFIGKLSVRGISEFLAGGDLTVIVDSVGLLLGPATAGPCCARKAAASEDCRALCEPLQGRSAEKGARARLPPPDHDHVP